MSGGGEKGKAAPRFCALTAMLEKTRVEPFALDDVNRVAACPRVFNEAARARPAQGNASARGKRA
jgi:hypothetical protein